MSTASDGNVVLVEFEQLAGGCRYLIEIDVRRPASGGETAFVAVAGERLIVRLGIEQFRAAAVVDPETYEAADTERRERARRETQQALQRAERHSVSRTQPVFTTD